MIYVHGIYNIWECLFVVVFQMVYVCNVFHITKYVELLDTVSILNMCKVFLMCITDGISDNKVKFEK